MVRRFPQPPIATPAPSGRAAAMSQAGLAKLVVIEGVEAGRRFIVDGAVVMGRAHDAAVALADTAISRHHARIERQPDGRYVVVDLDSTNGTFLNGARVRRGVLAFGDRIRLAETVVLLFERHEPEHEKLVRRQKLEMFGVFGDGVIHDLNNMLGAMSGVADYLEGLPASTRFSDPQAREGLADLKAALKRATTLTRRIRALTRGEAESHTRIDLTALCDETARLVRRALGPTIGFTVEVEPGLAVTGDGGALHQLLLNLCLNARDAMPSGGRLRVAARRARRDELPAQGLSTVAEYLVVSVEDTGVGIAPADRDRIFEPFYTTKPEGSGLGLAIVREAVVTHNGKLAVESELGRGTRFDVYLRAAPPAHVSAPRLSAPRCGLVLVADDDAVMRRSVARVLSRRGFRVAQAASGAEAHAHLAGGGERPDVLLLDLDLGDMWGGDLLLMLRAMPDPPRVIIVSGALTPDREETLRREGADALLRKPTPMNQVVSTIEAVLGTSVTIDEEPTTERLLPVFEPRDTKRGH
jgi:two-component system, cell cycle sensor histidine kinase and response regulator CckA